MKSVKNSVSDSVRPKTEQVIRVGVISDTHIPDRLGELPSVVFEVFSNVNLILHAGDIATPVVLEKLHRLAPTVAVAGNNKGDIENFPGNLPKNRLIQLEGWNIGLIHGETSDPFLRLAEWLFTSVLLQGWISNRFIINRIKSRFANPNCIVFGHSHTPYVGRHDNILFFNPGSPVNRPGQRSIGVLEVSTRGLHPAIINF